MVNELSYYQHSGRFGLVGLAGGMVAAALVASILAPAYAYVIVWVPFIYANLLLCLGYGALAGVVGGGVARIFKVRNFGVATLIAVIGAGVGFYVSWLFWVYATLSGADIEVTLADLADPAVLWSAVLEINELGTWTIGHGSSSGGDNVSGAFLWVVWAGEAVCYLVPAVLVARAMLDQSFCDRCEHWCKGIEGVFASGVGDREELRRRLESKDFGWLKTLGPASDTAWWQYKLEACPQCGKTNTLSVELCTVTIDKKGKQEKKSETLMKRLLLTPEELQAFQKSWSEAIPAPQGA